MNRPSAALAVVLALCGALAGYLLRGASRDDAETARLQAELDAAQAARAAAEGARSAAETRAAAAERELGAARRDAQRVAREAEAAAAAAAAAPPPAPEAATDVAAAEEEETWRTRVGRYPAFAFEDGGEHIHDALAEIDWGSVAEHMSAMVPLIDEIAGALAAGRPPSPEALGATQQHNGPLVVAALRLQQEGVPGTGPNGSFTHPAFMTNAIAANLEALGLALDANQMRRLGDIGADYERRDRERLAAYADATPQIRKLADEAQEKGAFFEAALGVLRADQRTALVPEAARGRVALDLFSEGLVWVGRAQPLRFRDPAHLTELVEAQFIAHVDPAARDAAHRVVADWVAALPSAVTEREPDALEQNGILVASHVTTCALHVAQLVETLLRDVAVGDEAAQRLRAVGGTVVPLLQSGT